MGFRRAACASYGPVAGEDGGLGEHGGVAMGPPSLVAPLDASEASESERSAVVGAIAGVAGDTNGVVATLWWRWSALEEASLSEPESRPLESLSVSRSSLGILADSKEPRLMVARNRRMAAPSCRMNCCLSRSPRSLRARAAERDAGIAPERSAVTSEDEAGGARMRPEAEREVRRANH